MKDKIKICPKCGGDKRMRLKSGYTQCLLCHNERTRLWSKTHLRVKKWDKTQAAKDYRRSWHLNNRYGISNNEYNKLLDVQNGKCSICGGGGNGKSEQLCVDHEHKTGKIRGLLCNKCNVGLSNFRDNQEFLMSAIGYLRRAALLAVMEAE